MKRDQAVELILKELKNWEDSKLTKKCASNILKKLEVAGIICPPEIQIGTTIFEGKTVPLYGMEWEKSKKK